MAAKTIVELIRCSDEEAEVFETYGIRRGFMAENEDDGELVVVYVSSEEEKQIYVRRLDLTTWKWRRRKGPKLGDKNKMLYVSMGASILQTAGADEAARGMDNKIYLPRVTKENSCLFYSLATAKYSSFEGLIQAAGQCGNWKETLERVETADEIIT
ncbi:hypothetical protein COLO4_22280 [Corchorus olitorius]|uniref:Uncharacterized protein n=1 Tax=Corchorus olitorius TaxID=93759 RepID=A0A1R3IN29_9ROSI|nr:hypothetical protein COLO4_22280 [Corchorus olitorius]